MRLLLDTRVLDDRGDPVRGLTASDFIVKVGGKVARVESAVWVGGGASEEIARPADAEPERPAGADDATDVQTSPTERGRLIVFLFQKSLEPGRIVGFMRSLIDARGMLDSLSPGDRVAVLSFDSSLQVWQDFTNDYARIRRIFKDGILFERAGPVQEAAGVSLVRRLGPHEARRTYTIERALWRIGDALADVPGAKSLVLVGHGFGRFGPNGVSMENDYEPMGEALQQARVSVFSLDVTTADYHSLELGLQLVSEHTGGFFARMHHFPARAVRTLLGALAGHYTLFVELPTLDEGEHKTEVTLAHKKGNVLARATYVVARHAKRPENTVESPCRVTTPVESFVPPPPYPDTPPGGRAFWYGTSRLWTMLPASGRWDELPGDREAFRQKVLLWRPGYDGREEQWPNATVAGYRLDGEADPIVAQRATNAYRRDFGGWAMLVDIEIPSAGCWALTATYDDVSIDFTVEVP
jgi:hypothetical protein